MQRFCVKMASMPILVRGWINDKICIAVDQNREFNLMSFVLVAGSIAAAMYLSMQGVVGATYFLLSILMLNIIFVSYTAAATIGFLRTMLIDHEKYLKITNKPNDDTSVQILIRCMLLMSAYQIFLLGYVFIAGAASVTIAISLTGFVFTRAADWLEK